MSEPDDLQKQIYRSLDMKQTDELLNIWKTNDRIAWTDDAFLAIAKILKKRLGTVPPQEVDIKKQAVNFPLEYEFYLVMPDILKTLFISLALFVVGFLINGLKDLFFRYSIPQFIEIVVFAMIGFGFSGSIVFGLMSLIQSGDILRFRPIKKIVLSSSGFTLINKDETIARAIPWQQIKNINIHGLKHYILFAIETSREPVGITINLLDGSKYKIPLDLILKVNDRRRMEIALNRFSFAVVAVR